MQVLLVYGTTDGQTQKLVGFVPVPARSRRLIP